MSKTWIYFFSRKTIVLSVNGFIGNCVGQFVCYRSFKCINLWRFSSRSHFTTSVMPRITVISYIHHIIYWTSTSSVNKGKWYKWLLSVKHFLKTGTSVKNGEMINDGFVYKWSLSKVFLSDRFIHQTYCQRNRWWRLQISSPLSQRVRRTNLILNSVLTTQSKATNYPSLPTSCLNEQMYHIFRRR